MDVKEPTQLNEIPSAYSKTRVRIAVSFFYFAQGICFATWASRIPDLKTTLQLSDGQLGSILLALPLGQLITMPFSGRLTTAFGTKKMLIIGAPLYALAMANLSLASAGWQLALFLLLFGIAGNICNNALNTQGVVAETYCQKPIMSSFHGVWSVGGFAGALVGLLMINLQVAPMLHFVIIGILVWIHIVVNQRFLLAGQKSVGGKKTSFFKKPQNPSQ